MDELFVTCPHSFEQLLQQELKHLGITKSRLGFCGVYIPQEIDNVYTVNYCSRVATRVLWPLARFGCPDREALYSMAKKIPWLKFLSCDKTFAIDANVQNHPELRNSLFAALVVKDAICDYFRDKQDARPSINVQNPDVQLNLFIQKGQAYIYLDTSGFPLHKRGWRLENTEATLHESLAAGLLLLSGYSGKEIFCDPFCGSGTFLMEAALIATHTPPGYFRKTWGFFHLPEFNDRRWTQRKEEIDSHIIPLEKGKILGSDKDVETFKICYRHIKHTGFRGLIELENKDIADYQPPAKPTFLLCNPPYGKRLEVNKGIYESLGRFLQTACEPNVKAYVLTSDKKMVELLPRKIEKTFPFKTGGLDVSLYSLSWNP